MTLTLLDWRRRVAALYAAARSSADPEARLADVARRPRRAVRAPSGLPAGRGGAGDLPGLPFAAYDPALRFEPRAGARGRRAPRGPHRRRRRRRRSTGSARWRLGDLGPVDVWWLGGYGGGVFLPLRDGSAGPDTYGGGRYLLDTVKGADLGGDGGRLVVDLNFAYHPSCTYDPRWSCPLAPEGNRLTTPVAAGEQLPPGGWY